MIKSAILKTTFKYVKKHWKELLLIVSLFTIVGKSHMDYKRLEKAYETSQNSLKNQIVSLKELHANELALRDQALKDYQETIKKLEKRHEDQLQDLEDSTSKEQVEIVKEIVTRKQFSENKDELADKLKAEFGFEYAR